MTSNKDQNYLVVLKNISQIGSFPQGWTIWNRHLENIFEIKRLATHGSLRQDGCGKKNVFPTMIFWWGTLLESKKSSSRIQGIW